MLAEQLFYEDPILYRYIILIYYYNYAYILYTSVCVYSLILAGKPLIKFWVGGVASGERLGGNDGNECLY